MNKGIYSSIVLLALTGAASGPQAQTKPQSVSSPAPTSRVLVRPEDAPKAGGLDRQFAREAAEAGAAEVALAGLAGERAASEKVKGFAQQMIQDHTNANQELERLAAGKKIPLPPSTRPGSPSASRPKSEAEAMSRLSALSGADFDREYMRQAMRDHDQAVALFEHQADDGKDGDLKAWAAKMLPTLRDHQRLAREVAAAIGAVTK